MPESRRLFADARWMIFVGLLSVWVGPRPVFAAPANDNFAQATIIPSRPELISGTTAGATAEAGEVNWASTSVWYKWLPDQSGGWEVSYVGGLNGDLLIVFAGDSFQTFKQAGFAMGESSQSLWVDAGTTYYIRVEAGRNGGNPFTIRFIPGPVNDSFVGGIRLPDDGTFEASMLGASVETGEPDYGPMQGRTLWWEWTAPETGSYYISVPYVEFALRISVFQGSSISSLARVTSQDVYGTNGMHTVFRASVGETYALRVTAVTFEKGVIHFGLHKGPLNDDWEKAASIEKLNNEVKGNTTGSTYQSGETKRREHGGGSVWYWWEVPATGAYVARSVSEVGLGEIGVYRGSSLSTLVSLQQAAPSYNPPGECLFPFRATAGEKLYISVDPAGLGTGPFSLNIVTPAANDDFAAAERLEGRFATSPWRSFLATIEPNEPGYTGIRNIGSLWWRWTAPSAGTYLVHSEHDVKPVALGIYSGASLATLTKITAQTNRADLVFAGFYSEAGREYYIHLAQDVGTSEPVRMMIEPGASNDEIAYATTLFGSPATDSVFFRIATQEPDEPLAFPGKGTLWWKWSAPASGAYIFSASGGFLDNQIEVAAFSGATRSELRLVGRAMRGQTEAALAFRAAQGEEFYFVVAEPPADDTDPQLIRVSVDSGPRNDDFANATVLTGQVNYVGAATRGATRESGEPNHGLGEGGSSVWFKWTAPFTQKVLVGVDHAGVTGRVYRGSALQNLEAIPNANISMRDLSLSVSPGVEYFFALESSSELSANFHFRLGNPPANDNYANRELIDQFGVRYRSWTVFAGAETSEARALGVSVWWTWTAPDDGIGTMQTEASGTIARPEIYYREPLLGPPQFYAQGALAVSPTNRAAVVAGRTYDIRLVTQVPSVSVGLILNFIPAPENNVWSDDEFLRGGTSLWTEQTNVVHSGPTGMRPGPSLPFERSWIQRTFVGSGRLSFWWRKTDDRLTFEVMALPGQTAYVMPQQPSSAWTRMEMTLNNGTNVVRWTAQKLASAFNEPPAVYLDDVEFTPHSLTLLSPRLNNDGSIGLALLVDFGQGHHNWQFEISDDLRTWTPWTNRFVENTKTNTYELRVTNQPSVSERKKFFRVKR